MNQEPASENNRPITEPGAGEKSPRYPTEKQHTKAWEIFGNVIGIVLGVPVFVAGLWLSTGALHGDYHFGLAGFILLLISIGLFIPSRLYDHGRTRAIGFVALSLATAVTVYCAAFLGWLAYNSLSDPPTPDEFGWWVLVVMIGVGYAIAFLYAISCTCVLLFKIKPRPAHAVVGIAAGIVVGALMSYLLFFRD